MEESESIDMRGAPKGVSKTGGESPDSIWSRKLGPLPVEGNVWASRKANLEQLTPKDPDEEARMLERALQESLGPSPPESCGKESSSQQEQQQPQLQTDQQKQWQQQRPPSQGGVGARPKIQSSHTSHSSASSGETSSRVEGGQDLPVNLSRQSSSQSIGSEATSDNSSQSSTKPRPKRTKPKVRDFLSTERSPEDKGEFSFFYDPNLPPLITTSSGEVSPAERSRHPSPASSMHQAVPPQVKPSGAMSHTATQEPIFSSEDKPQGPTQEMASSQESSAESKGRKLPLLPTPEKRRVAEPRPTAGVEPRMETSSERPEQPAQLLYPGSTALPASVPPHGASRMPPQDATQILLSQTQRTSPPMEGAGLTPLHPLLASCPPPPPPGCMPRTLPLRGALPSVPQVVPSFARFRMPPPGMIPPSRLPPPRLPPPCPRLPPPCPRLPPPPFPPSNLASSAVALSQGPMPLPYEVREPASQATMIQFRGHPQDITNEVIRHPPNRTAVPDHVRHRLCSSHTAPAQPSASSYPPVPHAVGGPRPPVPDFCHTHRPPRPWPDCSVPPPGWTPGNSIQHQHQHQQRPSQTIGPSVMAAATAAAAAAAVAGASLHQQGNPRHPMRALPARGQIHARS